MGSHAFSLVIMSSFPRNENPSKYNAKRVKSSFNVCVCVCVVSLCQGSDESV